jgi:hypothetical protein
MVVVVSREHTWKKSATVTVIPENYAILVQISENTGKIIQKTLNLNK